MVLLTNKSLINQVLNTGWVPHRSINQIKADSVVNRDGVNNPCHVAVVCFLFIPACRLGFVTSVVYACYVGCKMLNVTRTLNVVILGTPSFLTARFLFPTLL